MYPGNYPKKRYRITKAFLEQAISKQEKIIDLGVVNPFSEILKKEGYNITNTTGEDLDNDTKAVQDNNYDVATAFEIFEHLVSPLHCIKRHKS